MHGSSSNSTGPNALASISTTTPTTSSPTTATAPAPLPSPLSLDQPLRQRRRYTYPPDRLTGPNNSTLSPSTSSRPTHPTTVPRRCVVLASSCDCPSTVVVAAAWAQQPLACRLPAADGASRIVFASALALGRDLQRTGSRGYAHMVSAGLPPATSSAPSNDTLSEDPGMGVAVDAPSTRGDGPPTEVVVNTTVEVPVPSNTTFAPTNTTATTAAPTHAVSPDPLSGPPPRRPLPATTEARVGHQESIFVQLLSRIEALELGANTSAAYVGQLAQSHVRLNASHHGVVANASNVLTQMKFEIAALTAIVAKGATVDASTLHSLSDGMRRIEAALVAISSQQHHSDEALNYLMALSAGLCAGMGVMLLSTTVLVYRVWGR